MNNIFYGMLFVFLDVDIRFGNSVVGFLPDFIGYILIAYGLKELTAGADRFSRARPVALVMAVFTAVLYGIRLLGISVFILPAALILLDIASLLAALYVSYGIVSGIKELEANLEQDLGAQRLFRVWTIQAILSLAIFGLALIPTLATLCFIAAIIAGIIFLVFLNNTRKLYYGGA